MVVSPPKQSNSNAEFGHASATGLRNDRRSIISSNFSSLLRPPTENFLLPVAARPPLESLPPRQKLAWLLSAIVRANSSRPLHIRYQPTKKGRRQAVQTVLRRAPFWLGRVRSCSIKS